MAFTLERFAQLRPHLFHTTSAENIDRIRTLRRLQSAACLAGKNHLAIRTRRADRTPVDVDGATVMLMDQEPLHENNIKLCDGWTFQDLLADLNSRVFFWPGTVSGPSKHGWRHFMRYSNFNIFVLRVRFEDIVNTAGRPPTFARYNTGAPRFSGGRASPRGPDTFTNAAAPKLRVGDVVEVTFRDEVFLPRVEYATDPSGPWTALWDA